jgi:catechol-2,3-dioxygenase
MPVGHIGINVSDLATAKAYYDELMPKLLFEPFIANDGEFSYRPADSKIGTWLFFYQAVEDGDHSRHRAGLQHVAFHVPTRRDVDALHEWATRRGDPIVHAPRLWPEYMPHYYATFWLDPHGFMLEALCYRDPSS